MAWSSRLEPWLCPQRYHTETRSSTKPLPVQGTFPCSGRARDSFESTGIRVVFPLPMPRWRTITQVLSLGRKTSPWGGSHWLQAFISPSHISLPSAPAGSTQPYRGSLRCNSIPACPDTIFMEGARQPTEPQKLSLSSCAMPAGEAGARLDCGVPQPYRHTRVQNHLAPGSTAPSPRQVLGHRDTSWAANPRQRQYQAPAAKLQALIFQWQLL